MSVFLVSCSVFVDIHQLEMLGFAYPFPSYILQLGWEETADLHGIGGGDRCLWRLVGHYYPTLLSLGLDSSCA